MPVRRDASPVRSALVMIGFGLLLLIAAGGARLAFVPTKYLHIAITMGLLLGGALVVIGVLGGLFTVATTYSFEWYIAWRYLCDRGGGRSWIPLASGGALALGAVGALIASYVLRRYQLDEMILGPSPTVRLLQIIALSLGGFAYVLLFLGLLLRSFSLFTSISIFGVFLGSAALVVVLSVMGGFEDDLRQKILGTTSHVIVTKPKGMFTEHRDVLSRIADLKDVAAFEPFIESEVMITSQTNLSGVLLRGIDPDRIGKVTDLPKYLKPPEGSGSLEDLLHPERLAKIPEARFRPMVTAPLGEPPDDDEEASSKKGPAEREKGKRRIDEKQKGEREAIPSNASKRGRDGDLKVIGEKAGIVGEHPKEKDKGPKRRLSIWDVDVDKEIGKKIPPRAVYPGIIIGAELAKNLRLYIGDDVNVVAPLGAMSPAGPIPKSRPFRVAGIFYSGTYEYDNRFAYVTIPAAQRFLGLEGEITGVEIRVSQLEAASPLAEEIKAMLPGEFEVQDWKEMNQNLFSALRLEKVAMFLLLSFIVLVAAFSIITNLNMVVLEKGREISALKTMGAKHQAVLKIFLYAGIYIGIIGMLVGVLTGVGACLFLAYIGLPLDPEVYYISVLPVRMNPADVALVALASVSLSLLATIYPSLLAARLRPVEGLRLYE